MAKVNALSLLFTIVPQVVNNTMSDLGLLKSILKEAGMTKAFNCNLDDSSSLEAASNEPYDVYDDKSIIRQNIRSKVLKNLEDKRIIDYHMIIG